MKILTVVTALHIFFGLSCPQACDHRDIRLISTGSNPLEGRVEVCVNGVWGTVCHDLFQEIDAIVACRQLGYSDTNATALMAFGGGTGPILLDDVRCVGTESALVDCAYDSHTADCLHYEDAGVRCQYCTRGLIRFVGGSLRWEGRVEVCDGRTWGTVCDNMWDTNDASVACRQAGFLGAGSTAFSGAQSPFGAGIGLIHFNNIRCTGSEDTLFSCVTDLATNCVHSQDAGIRCMPGRICDDGELRLAGGATEMQGRVEICFNRTWGTVCNFFWTTADRNVVCRQLGFSQFSLSFGDGTYNFGIGMGPIYLASPRCIGTEMRLTDCQNGSLMFCTHEVDASALCQPKLCNDGDVRLSGSFSYLSGRVEICYNETYGTVCDVGFGREEAGIVCSQLGFSRTRASAVPSAAFGPGTGMIFLASLGCVGNETHLFNCRHGGTVGATGCSHSQDASVVCQPSRASPQNVTARALLGNDVSVIVRWTDPLEFPSTLLRFIVNCTSELSNQSSSLSTQGPTEYTLVIRGLSPFTNYSCCVVSQYSNTRDNVQECARVLTQEGVPLSAPTNLVATPNPRNCRETTFSWDLLPPNERNGIITGYDVNVMPTDGSGTTNTFRAPTNTFTANTPSCCSGFQFNIAARTSAGSGPSSSFVRFTTQADNINLISVSAVVTDATSLSIRWTFPSDIRSQDVSFLTIELTPQCSNGTQPSSSLRRNITHLFGTSANFGGLRPFVPYQVLVTVVICQNVITLYNTSVTTQSAMVTAPVINSAVRNDSMVASVTFFVSPSLQNSDYFEIKYYEMTGPANAGADTMGAPFRSSIVIIPGTYSISTLTACVSYWVTVTAVNNCGVRLTSVPAVVGLQQPLVFEATLSLPAGQQCSSWVNVGTRDKIVKLASSIHLTLVGDLCRMASIRCTSNGTLTCNSDSSLATYRVTLVGTSSSSSAQQVQCLNQWATTPQVIRLGREEVTLTSTVIPEPPTGIPHNIVAMLSSTNCSTVTLTWNPPPETTGNGVIYDYTIRLWDRTRLVSTLTSIRERLVVESLECCARYTVQIVARTSETFIPSQNVSFSTSNLTTADLISRFMITVNTGPSYISISWSTSPIGLQRYTYFIDGLVTANNVTLPGSGAFQPRASGTSNFTGLDPDSSYVGVFAVRACGNNYLLFSEVVSTTSALFNLNADTLLSDCSSVTLSWSISPEARSNVDHYTITLWDNLRGVRSTYLSRTESITLPRLECCTSYTYQVMPMTITGHIPSQNSSFATHGLNSPVTVSTVPGINSITVSWTPISTLVPHSVQVVVTPECTTGILVPQSRTLMGNQGNSVTASGLDASVSSYRVHVTVVTCQRSQVHNETTTIRTVNPIGTPIITSIFRTSPTLANFDITLTSVQNGPHVFEISYYTTSVSPSSLVRTFRTNDSRVVLNNLNPCTSYWVVVTAIDCTNRVTGAPQSVGLFQPLLFRLIISIDNSIPCQAWILDNSARKLSDIGLSITTTLRSSPCNSGVSTPCTSNSRFTCGADPSRVIYETLLASTNSFSSSQQLLCLTNWIARTNTLVIAGIPAQITAGESPQATQTTTESSSGTTPAYIWAVVAVAIAAVIITAIVLVMVIVIVAGKKSASMKSSGNQGFIANPVFADQSLASSHNEYVAVGKELTKTDEINNLTD